MTETYSGKRRIYEATTDAPKELVFKNIRRVGELAGMCVWGKKFSSYESYCIEFQRYGTDMTKEEFETMESVYTSDKESLFMAFVRKMYGYTIDYEKACDYHIAVLW